ncbi:MAG: hypothetical protein IPK17_32305 [Chloroflexi bacterium]|uniref:hypothetical protein n=1 Tax=Candidatus Flexifilum breve TaxID=3140694 RepID=UPI00313633E7|nr:hypothetical protein [Chloroflexota bacterium]
MRTLLPVAALSVFFGFVLARSQYNELIGLIITTIYGGCFVVLIAALNDPAGLGRGIYNVFIRLFTWIVDATTGGINQDNLIFTLLVSSLFWFSRLQPVMASIPHRPRVACDSTARADFVGEQHLLHRGEQPRRLPDPVRIPVSPVDHPLEPRRA